ncbi:hypothetical protein LY90DRAFT_167435 [Neocallimastix californiae]|uniref:Uncharacterized protein n=1 Tax=Neocallimastix californiae TaxID=1754190 RepID=A0A1Y2EQA8_9FUNG|nr:hypothetical protein LY90DRAFT_167435 [Neocallimastix californiae]|eukprot:ORY73773.1 hypothetical protein LY90DRAFT_167435 [Neocallimastix californiae]
MRLKNIYIYIVYIFDKSIYTNNINFIYIFNATSSIFKFFLLYIKKIIIKLNFNYHNYI